MANTSKPVSLGGGCYSKLTRAEASELRALLRSIGQESQFIPLAARPSEARELLAKLHGCQEACRVVGVVER